MEAILLVIGFCGMIGSIIGGLVGMDNPQTIYFCLKIFGGCAVTACVGAVIAERNSFCSLKSKIDESAANVDVYGRQQTELEKTLKDLLEKYIAHEKGLLDLVKERTTENLLALLERYPELKANDGIMKLTEQLTGLRKDISCAEKHYNDAARQYNSETMQFPQKYFRPNDLPATIEYK
jgi:hypothetical protein